MDSSGRWTGLVVGVLVPLPLWLGDVWLYTVAAIVGGVLGYAMAADVGVRRGVTVVLRMGIGAVVLGAVVVSVGIGLIQLATGTAALGSVLSLVPQMFVFGLVFAGWFVAPLALLAAVIWYVVMVRLARRAGWLTDAASGPSEVVSGDAI